MSEATKVQAAYGAEQIQVLEGLVEGVNEFGIGVIHGGIPRRTGAQYGRRHATPRLALMPTLC